MKPIAPENFGALGTWNPARLQVFVTGRPIVTLLAVPVIYSLVDDVAEWRKRRAAKNRKVDLGEAELDAILAGGDGAPLANPHPVPAE